MDSWGKFMEYECFYLIFSLLLSLVERIKEYVMLMREDKYQGVRKSILNCVRKHKGEKQVDK
jgi:hypothetical protein